MKYNHLIIYFFLTVSIIQAQFKDIKFDKISVKEGLSQSTVTSIVQDSIGFIWFGTYEGLCRYDGYSFKVYKTEDKPSNGLSDNFIKCLYVDSQGVLWIGTASGLSVYDQDKDKFNSYKHDENNNLSLSGNDIPVITGDNSGAIWIGTFSDGLNRFNKEDSTFTRFVMDHNNPEAINDNFIQSLHVDKNSNLWVGTTNGGLNRFDRDKNIFFNYTHSEENPNSIAGNIVHDIIEDKNGNLILSIWERSIDFFDIEKEIFMHKSFDYAIYDMVLYNEDFILAGSRNNGFVTYSISDSNICNYKNIEGVPESLSSNSVYSILKDNTGTIWLGTSGGGISKFNPGLNNFTSFQNNPMNKNSLNNNYILSIIEDKYNNIWAGTRGGGLNKFDPVKNTWTVYKHNKKNPNSISDNIISSLHEDSKGNVWIGTENGGLNRFYPETQSFKSYKSNANKNNSINSNWVMDIHEDKEGIFWLSTFTGGLNRFDPETEIFTSYLPEISDEKSISGEALTKLYEDNENNIWIGTLGYGLNKFNKIDGTFTHYRHNNKDTTSLSSDLVLCVIRSMSNTVWVGTTNGLNRLNNDDIFTQITVNDGLPSNEIYEILEDDNGILWISTSKGLVKYNPRNGSVKLYNEDDGLPGNELNFGPAFKSKSGKMFFGGVDGFFYFNPDSLRTNNYLPPVVFTDFSINYKPAKIDGSITFAKEITLNYDENIFSLSFAALNYFQSSKNSFAYKLEGFDDKWNYIDKERKVSFTNLDPGNYVLKVKASNNDGIWNEKERSIAITIIAPYWQTWWFRSIITIILLSVGPIIYYKRISTLKHERLLQHKFSKKLINSQEQERSRIAQELHDSLGQELLLIRNRAMLGLKSINEETKIKKQLEYISESAFNAINQVRQISHNLRPPELDRLGLTETLRSLVNEIEGAGIIKIVSSIDNIDGLIEKDKEINLLRIFQESAANIIKHAEASEMEIKVLTLRDTVEVLISDNGKGFDSELNNEVNTKGLGFSGMKERASILGGNILINSSPGRGTKIKLELPVTHE